MNKVILIGRLTRDPEPGVVAATGKNLTKFALAVNDSRNSKAVSYFDCVTFDRQADVANTYLKKGSQICVDGRISINTYTDRNGIERKGINVTVDNFQMLGGSSDRPKTSTIDDSSPIGAGPGPKTAAIMTDLSDVGPSSDEIEWLKELE